MLKQIPVSELTPGMMVTQVLEQSGAVKIRKVGFIRSTDMVRGLKEMGVTLLEVDLDQSLTVESDTDEELGDEIAAEDDRANITTATQRLVKSTKQVSDVDRQLSQQFYRSSFMPAVDQMPSKWTIYGKFYAILLVYIVIGVLVGGVSSYTLLMVSNNSNLSIASFLEPRAAKEPVAATNSAANGVNPTDEITREIALPDSTNSPSVPAQAYEGITGNGSAQSTASSAADNKVLNELPVAAQVKVVKSPTPPKQDKPPVQRKLVNGVLLEAGQQVLGYQGSDDEVEETIKNPVTERSSATNNTNSRNSSATSNSEPINSELFRRIQRVAKDVDDQPNDPQSEMLKVTDFNDLPRIDQLSPAVLMKMPAMSFSAHMYASSSQDRWVRVNGRRVAEGDIIDDSVILKRIEAEKVVLELNGTEFTMNALSDW